MNDSIYWYLLLKDEFEDDEDKLMLYLVLNFKHLDNPNNNIFLLFMIIKRNNEKSDKLLKIFFLNSMMNVYGGGNTNPIMQYLMFEMLLSSKDKA